MELNCYWNAMEVIMEYWNSNHREKKKIRNDCTLLSNQIKIQMHKNQSSTFLLFQACFLNDLS